MAMINLGPKRPTSNSQRIWKAQRDDLCFGKQPSPHKTKLATSFGRAQYRWVHSGRFVCWKLYVKTKQEVNVGRQSHLVTLG